MRWDILSSEYHAPPNSRSLQHDVLRRVAFAISNVLETNKTITQNDPCPERKRVKKSDGSRDAS